jgi:hypothetical protein
MKRLTVIATALAMAVLAVLATGVAAQETNTSERTFLTFSAAVEMPGVTLQPGTYVFKLADTPTRNVVQVWDNDEKNMIGHWLFVQAERPQVTSENVIMFKETAAGTTPAVQYWYFPGERIGKEFIYPKDQALRIAARSGVGVRTEEGVVEGPGIAAVEAVVEAPAPAAEVSVQAEAAAPAAELPREANVDAGVAVETPRQEVSAQASVSPEPDGFEARAVGTSGRADELPATASPLALSGLLGLLSLAGAAALRKIQ